MVDDKPRIKEQQFCQTSLRPHRIGNENLASEIRNSSQLLMNNSSTTRVKGDHNFFNNHTTYIQIVNPDCMSISSSRWLEDG